MITSDKLKAFAREHRARTSSGTATHPSRAQVSPAARGITESHTTLRAYLESRGVGVKTIKQKPNGKVLLILDECPMRPDHGAGDSDTAVIWRPNGVIGFKCWHDRCSDYHWRDVRSQIDPSHTGSEIASVQDWEPPIPLTEFKLPVFPIEAIPRYVPVLSEFCLAVAESYQVPVDLPVMLALSVGGASLAKRMVVHPRADHREPVNLFIAVAMEPANRKTGVFRHVVRPLSDFERTEAARLEPIIDESRVKRMMLEGELKHVQGKAAKATKAKDREEHKERAIELADELRRTPVLLSPRYIADDATPERLSTLMRDHGGRIALLSPEGDTFDLMAGRYSSTGTPNLGVYLKGHAGDDIRVDRVSKDRPAEFVQSPALSIGLAVQPEVLRGLMFKPGFRGRGLLARLLYSIPASTLGRRKIDPAPIPGAVSEGYGRLIRCALELKPAKGPSGELQPEAVGLDAEALAEFDRFLAAVEADLAEGGQFDSMKDWAGKLAGAVCRIAGIFHGLRYAPIRTLASTFIDVETMLCAIAIGEYLIPHAKAAHFMMGANPAIGLARKLLRWLADEHLAQFSRRDAFNRLRGTIRQVEELDAPMGLLLDHSYIRPIPTTRSGPGRKPSALYEANPVFLAQNSHNTQNSHDGIDSAHSAHCAQEVES